MPTWKSLVKGTEKAVFFVYFIYSFIYFRASGSVYKAVDTRTKKKVAIKQMIIAQQVKKEILINEITIMKESHHHGIVNYIDSYIVGGTTLWVRCSNHHRHFFFWY